MICSPIEGPQLCGLCLFSMGVHDCVICVLPHRESMTVISFPIEGPLLCGLFSFLLRVHDCAICFPILFSMTSIFPI